MQAAAIEKEPKLPLDKLGQPIPKVTYPYGVKKNLGQKDAAEVSEAAAAEVTQLAIDAGTVRDPNMPPQAPEVLASIYPAKLPDLEWPPKPNPLNPDKPKIEYLNHARPAVFSMQLPKSLKPVTKKQMDSVAEKLQHLRIRQYYAYQLNPEVDF